MVVQFATIHAIIILRRDYAPWMTGLLFSKANLYLRTLPEPILFDKSHQLFIIIIKPALNFHDRCFVHLTFFEDISRF